MRFDEGAEAATFGTGCVRSPCHVAAPGWRFNGLSTVFGLLFGLILGHELGMPFNREVHSTQYRLWTVTHVYSQFRLILTDFSSLLNE